MSSDYSLDYWKSLLQSNIEKSVIENLLWEYVESLPDFGRFIDSEEFNIKSKIIDYTCKSGKIMKLHIAFNGEILDSVKHLGNEPTFYKGHFPITRKHFKINFDNINLFMCKYIHHLFEPYIQEELPEQ
jgi:hypothetical protein